MKQKFGIFFVLLLGLSLLTNASDPLFKKGDLVLTGQIGMDSYAIPFGAALEFGLTENISLGASLMVQMWSEDLLLWDEDFGYSSTLITPAIEAAYHLTSLEIDKMDLYGGVAVGYSIYSFSWNDGEGEDDDIMGGSGIFVSPFVGGRYYFSPKLALNIKVNFSALGDFTGVGATVGLSFKLK